MIETVRIISHGGKLATATLLERAGDFGITQEGEFHSVVTHLPTGLLLTGTEKLSREAQQKMLVGLAILPKWDFQTVDIPLLKTLVKAAGGKP